MAIYISQFGVDHFRGIHNLKIDNINHVNIIAGDNNCGKTSILEAMLLFRNPSDITNVLRTARIREPNVFMFAPVYENFINFFPKGNDAMVISINSLCNGDKVLYQIVGERKKVMLEPEDLYRRYNSAQRRRALEAHDSGSVEAPSQSHLLCCYDKIAKFLCR